MKVLHVYRYDEGLLRGGIERHLQDLCQELRFSTDITLLVSALGWKHEALDMPWGKLIRLPRLADLASITVNPGLAGYLKKLDYNILHIHWAHPFAVMSYLWVRPKKPLVITYHMDVVKWAPVTRVFHPFLARFLDAAQAIVVGSPSLLSTSKALAPYRDKCVVIPYGIAPEDFQLSEETARQAGEIRQAYPGPLVLFVGRLVWYKGLKFMIEAMRKISATLLVVGNGPFRRPLQRLAARRGIPHKVIFLGTVPSVVPYYHAADLLVLPSVARTESFGMVLLEAMASGTAVISTELGTGTSWVNRHGETGLVVPPADAHQLVEAVNRLLEDHPLRKRLGEEGKKRAGLHFSTASTAQGLIRLYRELAPV